MAKNTGPTLSDITAVGRQVVKFGAIAIVVMIIGRTLLTAMVAYWKALNPPPPPPPTMGFGVLPQLRFPEQIEATRPKEISLETPNGTLPFFGDRAKVFYMPQSTLTLFADQNARQIAANYGFIFQPDVLSSRLYRWSKTKPLESTLQLDIQTKQLKLSTNFLSRPDLNRRGVLPLPEKASDQVKAFLSRSELMGRDMATVSGKITYLRASGTRLNPALSQSDADYMQVDIDRTPIDGTYRMYTPIAGHSVVRAVISGAFQSDEGIVSLIYNYHPVDYSQIETYPIQTAQDAWAQLKSGGGYIAGESSDGSAIVRRVYLGYYDDFEEQEYLQPIYVFEGDKGFAAYVSALDPRVIEQDEAANSR